MIVTSFKAFPLYVPSLKRKELPGAFLDIEAHWYLVLFLLGVASFFVGITMYILVFICILLLPLRGKDILLCMSILMLAFVICTNNEWHVAAMQVKAKTWSTHRGLVEGEVGSDPEFAEGKTRFTLSLPDNTHVAAVLPRFVDVELGDRVLLKGSFELPENFSESFSYTDYLLLKNITLRLSKANIQSISKPRNPPWEHYLFAIKRRLQYTIQTLWPGDSGGWISGILLGARSDLSQDLKDNFQRTGLTHIVAVSGFNITIIISLLFTVLKPLSLSLRVVVSLCSIALFALFVGASAAVVRASLMGGLALIVLLLERNTASLYIVLLSACLMVALQPRTLLYDIGFQLSFCALFGLMYVEPLVRPWFLWLPKQFEIQEAVSTTIAAQIITTPLTLYYFQSFSLIAPLANLLVTPLIPLSMLLSFLAAISPISWITIPISILTKLLVETGLWITTLLGSLPFASLQDLYLPGGIWLVLGQYLILGLWIQKNMSKDRKNSLEAMD